MADTKYTYKKRWAENAGRQSVQLWLPVDVVEQLDGLPGTRVEVISRLVVQAAQALSDQEEIARLRELVRERENRIGELDAQ